MEVFKIKSRKQKAKIYNEKYNDIPKDYMERLSWMYDKYHMTVEKAAHISKVRKEMLQTLQYEKEYFIVLYEEPEGSPRPRARYANKSNIISAAKSNPGFIQVYSLTGASDRNFMKRYMSDTELKELEFHLIHTACSIEYDAYIKTPTSFNSTDTYLAELGLIRPLLKPDFDNIAKKYSDMYNGNIWIDDSLVIDGRIRKFYSILPRVEIRLRYMNMLYNKYQYKSMIKRVENIDEVSYFDTTK